MWTYLAYILNRYREITTRDEVQVSEVYDFHNKFMILSEHISFWENLHDLHEDVLYLKKKDVISVEDFTIKITDPKNLSKIAQVVRVKGKTPELYDVYKERIDRAMNSWLKV
jgi:hypothetical protein